jgi:hypothetical protein
MRLCGVEGEHHCSDDAKHRKSNKGSHDDLLGVKRSSPAISHFIRSRWHFRGGELSGPSAATAFELS